MQQLQFTELDEGGRLVLVADDGTRYAVPVDDRLRAALRPRPHSPTPDRGGSATSPREVQALIRAGQSAEEVAAATGWELERVRRFEGPVIAEREHVVRLAKAASVRAQGRTDGSHTLDRRVRERLQTRGVEDVAWDAARTDQQGPWTVVVAFTAGGRERRAAWHYDAQDRSIEALDDEARWLSEDEQALPGGLAGHPLLGTSTASDEANDLMATMRARRQRRSTVRRPRRAEDETTGEEGRDGADAGATQGRAAGGGLVDEVLPIEDFDFDHAAMGDPPAAHPRGSAAESPTPVGRQESADASEGSAEPAGDVVGGGPEGRSGAVSEDGSADGSLDAPGDADGEAEPRGSTARQARRRRERRRLRIPKLPPAVGGPAEDEESDEPEGTYARTRHDPNEVSFDEFFGTDEDDLDGEYEDDLDGEYEDDADSERADGVDSEHDKPDGGVELGDAGTARPTDGGGDDELDDELLEVEVDVAFDHDEPAEEAEEAGADGRVHAGMTDAAGTRDEDAPHPSAGRSEDPADEDAPPAAQESSAPESGQASLEQEPSTQEQESGSRKKGRTSVPSWDDIMFGSGTRKR